MNIALIGYGRMGRAVETLAKGAGHQIVSWVDGAHGWELLDRADAEVAIEFSVPEAVVENIRQAAGRGLDLAVGTTGWFDRLEEVEAIVREAGTGLVYAPNFSIGVHFFFRLVREAAELVNDLEDYDVYVSEVHHRHKEDHPSGTALHMAEIVLEEVDRKQSWTGQLEAGAIPPEILQVSSLRTGENPGTHTLGLEGPDDQILIHHQARGRGGFARGAVTAAEWIKGRKGVFTMEDMVEDHFGKRAQG